MPKLIDYFNGDHFSFDHLKRMVFLLDLYSVKWKNSQLTYLDWKFNGKDVICDEDALKSIRIFPSQGSLLVIDNILREWSNSSEVSLLSYILSLKPIKESKNGELLLHLIQEEISNETH